MSPTDGIAEMTLGVTFADGTPIPALLDFEGRGKRIAAKWFPGEPMYQLWCVGAIRDFVLAQPEGLDVPGQMKLPLPADADPETKAMACLGQAFHDAADAIERGEVA